MIRLGHIEYSNCVPVHALLLEQEPPDLVLVRDVPSGLNAALAEARIDAAPCSSIEYARHAGEYRILPVHVIGSHGPVQSILLESRVAPAELHGRTVALPTASATSVVLLRILLQERWRVRPHFEWFDQTSADDPLQAGADAVLRIGDVALRRTVPPDATAYDLGTEWTAWTGLPFAFAVWQVRRDLDSASVQRLTALLAESRAYFAANRDALAARHAQRFGLTQQRLLDYWASLCFDLDAAMQQGLLHFYAHAAALGEAPAVATLDLVAPS